MNLFDLTAKIKLDSSEYEKGIKGAESKISALGSKIGTATKVAGGVAAGAITASAVAVGKLAKDSVKAYANFEQLEGGVKKLFGDEASKQIMEYAENAYKTSGISANQYMEQATSFSAALINSLGGDTAQAAKLADEAMRAMSDNVNTFGSDMSSVQNAFQGFAKGNYTMLDNLKLGYGGTKEEMKRLIEDASKATKAQEELGLSVDGASMSFDNIVKAIQVAQYEQGIYGTTVNEAEKTVSGSMTMMKASWENLITAFGRGNKETKKVMRQFLDSVKLVIKNVIPVIKTAMSGIGTAIKEAVPAIQKELPGMVADVLPSLLDAAVKLVDGIVRALPGLMVGIVQTAGSVVDSIGAAITAKSPALGEAFKTIVDGVSEVFNSMSTVIQEKVLPVFNQIVDYITGTLVPQIQAELPKIQEIISGVFSRVKEFWDTVLSPVFTAIVDTVSVLLVPTLQTAFETIKTVVGGAFENIKNIWDSYLLPTFQALSEFVTGTILPVFQEVWPIVQEFVSNAFITISDLWNNTLSVAFNALYLIVTETILPAFQDAWPKIQTVVTSAINAITFLWENFLSPAFTAIHDFVVNTLLPAFEENWPKIKEAVTTAMSAIRNFWDHRLKPAFSKIITFVKDIKDNFEEKFESARTAVETAFSAIQTAWETLKTTFEELKEKVGAIKTKFKTVFDAVKKKVETVFGKIQEFWDETLGPVFDAISEKLGEIGTFWDETFGTMLTTVDNVWNGENGIKTTIKNAIDTVKGFFDFEWQFPTPKLPHFGVERWESLFGLVDVPVIGISWYAKAYDNPWLFDSKGVLGGRGFGDRGNYQGGELVYSRDKLMQDIREATGEGNKQPVTINIYQQPWQDAKELAREVGEILSNDYVREGAAYA